MCGKEALEIDWRGSTGGSNRQQDAADQHLNAEGASCIIQTSDARCRRSVSVCADDAGRAGAAVLRGPEMAEEIVMLELGREQEERVERYADERPAISRPASHRIDDITGRR